MHFGSYGYVRYLKKKWFTICRNEFWGDRLDVRFYLTWCLKGLHNKKILDIGCGPGIILSEIGKDSLCVGIDINFDSLKIAKLISEQGKLVEGNIQSLPFRGGEFDVVVVSCVFETLSDEQKEIVISEIARVIKLGGKIFITTTNKDHLRYRKKKGWYCMRYGQLKSALEKYFQFGIRGFNPFPPFPLFLPSRLLQYIPGIWGYLLWMMKKRIALQRSQFFYVEGNKYDESASQKIY